MDHRGTLLVSGDVQGGSSVVLVVPSCAVVVASTPAVRVRPSSLSDLLGTNEEARCSSRLTFSPTLRIVSPCSSHGLVSLVVVCGPYIEVRSPPAYRSACYGLAGEISV